MNKYIADIEQIYCCFSAYKKTKLFDCSLSPQKMIDEVKKLGWKCAVCTFKRFYMFYKDKLLSEELVLCKLDQNICFLFGVPKIRGP